MQNTYIGTFFQIQLNDENQMIDCCFQVTNYPKYVRETKLYGSSDITCMEERMIETIPGNLQDFFEGNSEVQN